MEPYQELLHLGQGVPGSNDNEGVIHIPHSSGIRPMPSYSRWGFVCLLGSFGISTFVGY